MMAFFWPAHLNNQVTAPIRAGRVAHWLGLIVGVLVALLAVGAVGGGYSNPATYPIGLIGLIPAQIGRGVRYILAGE